MDQAQLNWITDFIWGIADDTLALEQETEGLLHEITKGATA
jgi:hypothetical protein